MSIPVEFPPYEPQDMSPLAVPGTILEGEIAPSHYRADGSGYFLGSLAAEHVTPLSKQGRQRLALSPETRNQLDNALDILEHAEVNALSGGLNEQAAVISVARREHNWKLVHAVNRLERDFKELRRRQHKAAIDDGQILTPEAIDGIIVSSYREEAAGEMQLPPQRRDQQLLGQYAVLYLVTGGEKNLPLPF